MHTYVQCFGSDLKSILYDENNVVIFLRNNMIILLQNCLMILFINCLIILLQNCSKISSQYFQVIFSRCYCCRWKKNNTYISKRNEQKIEFFKNLARNNSQKLKISPKNEDCNTILTSHRYRMSQINLSAVGCTGAPVGRYYLSGCPQ